MQVGRIDIGRAGDETFVAAVTAVVNAAYHHAEAGMWRVPVDRLTVDATGRAITAGELVLATDDDVPVGAVLTRPLDDTTGWFGALAVEPGRTGQGIGRALIEQVHADAAAAGLVRVQLERLDPTPRHPHTDRLARWYRSLGYVDVSRTDFAPIDPTSAARLIGRCDLVVCRRDL